MYTCRLARNLYWERYEVIQFLQLFSWKQNSLKGYLYCLQVFSNAVFTWQLGWDFLCVYKRRVGIKREEFNKPFSHHLHLLFRDGFCKVHEEPFERGLNCFHAFFSIFNPGWSLNSAFPPWFTFNPCCHVNVLLFLCASRFEIRQINITWVITTSVADLYKHLLFKLFDVPVYFDRLGGLRCI